MKFLKFSFVLVALLGLSTIWGCGDDTTAPPTIAGTWNLISATADNVALANPTMTVTLVSTDDDGNGTFSLSGLSANVVAFNGSNSGNYTLSGTSLITFTTGSASNTADITSSPLNGGTNWVVSFNASLAQHNDKDETAYTYTFQLQ